MGKYITHITQGGEGCDYTIACGQTIITISADNIEEATENLFKVIKEEYSSYDVRLDETVLYEISESVNIPMCEWYKRIDNDEVEKEKQDKLDRDREEYLRLKKKFEND